MLMLDLEELGMPKWEREFRDMQRENPIRIISSTKHISEEENEERYQEHLDMKYEDSLYKTCDHVWSFKGKGIVGDIYYCNKCLKNRNTAFDNI